MPAKPAWIKSLQLGVRTGRKGWGLYATTSEKWQLKLNVDGFKDSAVLPIAVRPELVSDVLQLVGRLYQLLHPSYDKTLDLAIAEVLALSDKHSDGVMQPWEEVVEDLKGLMQTHKNQISENTWATNYAVYYVEALKLLKKKKAPRDGADLLKQLLELQRHNKKPGKSYGEPLAKWADLDNSRSYCCSAIRLLMRHAVERCNRPSSWLISEVQYNDLRGASSRQAEKAVLTDVELLILIEAIAVRSERWANVFKLLAVYGLRGWEIDYLQALKNPQGNWQLKVTKGKVSASRGRKTEGPPRWLVPLPLVNAEGEFVEWELLEQIVNGSLALPVNKGGDAVHLDGRSIGKALRRQPEWQEFVKAKAANGEHLKPYAFRDSYSVRGHSYGITREFLSPAMGHSEAVHDRSYRRVTYETMMAAFSQAASQA